MKNNRLNFKFVILASGFKYFYRIAIFILNQTYKQSIYKHPLPPPIEKKIFLKIKIKTFILIADNTKSANLRRFFMDRYACAEQFARLILEQQIKARKRSYVLS